MQINVKDSNAPSNENDENIPYFFIPIQLFIFPSRTFLKCKKATGGELL